MMNVQHAWTRRPLPLPAQACASRAAGSPGGLFQCAPMLEEGLRDSAPRGGPHLDSVRKQSPSLQSEHIPEAQVLSGSFPHLV